MVGAFVDLTLWSIRNRLRSQLRRLRQPRYLIGAIAGIAWFASIILRSGARGGDPARHVQSPLELAAHHGELLRFGGALVLCALALLMAFAGSSRAVEFSRAEVQWLLELMRVDRELEFVGQPA